MWSCCSITRRRYFSHIRYCFNKERKKVRNSRTFYFLISFAGANSGRSAMSEHSSDVVLLLSFRIILRLKLPHCLCTAEDNSFPVRCCKEGKKIPCFRPGVLSYLSVQSLFYTFCKLTLTHFHNGIFSILLCSACYNISFILPLRLHGINADINC